MMLETCGEEGGSAPQSYRVDDGANMRSKRMLELYLHTTMGDIVSQQNMKMLETADRDNTYKLQKYKTLESCKSTYSAINLRAVRKRT